MATGLVTLRELAHQPNIKPESHASTDEFYRKYMRITDQHELSLNTYECYLCNKVARLNDQVIFLGTKNSLRRPITAIWSRYLAVNALPLTAATDLGWSAMQGCYQGIKSLVVSNEGASREKMWLYLGRSKKCFLGLVASPAGLFCPDLVTQHFIHASFKNTVQPYGKHYSSSALEVFPETFEDVQKIILKAKKEGRKVAFAGALLSQGRQALPVSESDLVINFSMMNDVIIDPSNHVAYVQSGATWADVQNAANEHSLAVQAMQASNVFTVGGSLSVNCHGWDHRAGTLRNTIKILTIVNADGKLVTLSPKDELFHFAIGGLGGFGAIVQAELILTDNCPLTVQGDVVPPKEYHHYFTHQIAPAQDIDLHYYRLSLDPKHLFQTGVAVSYLKNDDQGVVSQLCDEPDRGFKADRIELQIVRRLDWVKKSAWELEKRNAQIDVKTSRNEAMRPPINAIFNDSVNDVEWLQEYFVTGEELSDFLQFLSGILTENQTAVFNASVRFVEQDTSPGFSYAQNSDMYAVVLFFNQSLKPEEVEKTRKWVVHVVDYLNDHGGSYYLPYQHFPSLSQFRSSYPNWKQVQEKKDQYDPDHLFQSGFYEEYMSLGVDVKKDHEPLLRSVLSGQKESVQDFIDSIFLQLDSSKFMELTASILSGGELSDDEIYQEMSERIGEASPGQFQKLRLALRSLKSLQDDLSDQVAQLLNDDAIEGYVEIGYPGRMVNSLKKKVSFQGPVYVVNERETLMDYIESGFPRPYNKFVPLNNYDPIRFEDIPSNSVSVVACYIGLHHIPSEKLRPFIRSIHRILKPGGHFILMDHDAHTQGLRDFVSAVHSIFNAGTGVSPEDEKAEVRNFQSLDYWTGVVEEHGLRRGPEKPLIRENDPTLNSLIKFTKESDLKLPVNSERCLIATYLTAPEWHNVRSAKAYADFIHHTPFYEFPYFGEIKRFWGVYANSWNAVRQHASFLEIATSEYNMMNMFIGAMMTVEYTAKGIISAPIAWFYGSEEYKEAETIHLIVKFNGVELGQVDPRIRVVDHKNDLAHIEIPRYIPFREILQKLADQNVGFINIAGQGTIQVDILVDRNQDVIPRGARFLYRTDLFDDPQHDQLSLDVDVLQLDNVLRNIREHDASVVYIHDF